MDNRTPSDTATIPQIVSTLHERTKRSYTEVCERMADSLNGVEYSINNFNRKFRRENASAHYEADEMFALVNAFVEGLSNDTRCRADEAFRLYARARISLDDFEALRALFPEKEYADAWAQYQPVADLKPENDPNFLKPFYPQIFVGREQDVHEIKARLGIQTKAPRRPITVVRGWPGVGKTTLVNRLIFDQDIIKGFPAGILWASLGPNANIFGTLRSWLTQLDPFYAGQERTVEDIAHAVHRLLLNKHILLVVDDIWQLEHGAVFKNLSTDKTTLLLTTRFTKIAGQLADMNENIYNLPVLTEQKSLELLGIIAPRASQRYQTRLGSLVKTLEGLPLALRVAGSLLEMEETMGLNVERLIDELERSHKLVKQTAPSGSGYVDEETGQTPTIALLFQRSVETLKPADQETFASLGVFAPKPATFDLEAIASICELDDPIPTVHALVDHGLLEPLGNARFQMHYTLSMYAHSLLEDDDTDDDTVGYQADLNS